MECIDFKDANKTLLKPDSMTDEECGSLRVYTDGKHCVSCWKPSWKERLSLLFFGRAWLYVFSGNTQPPVYIALEKTVFHESN